MPFEESKTLQGCNSDSASFQAIAPHLDIYYSPATACPIMLTSVLNCYKTVLSMELPGLKRVSTNAPILFSHRLSLFIYFY